MDLLTVRFDPATEERRFVGRKKTAPRIGIPPIDNTDDIIWLRVETLPVMRYSVPVA